MQFPVEFQAAEKGPEVGLGEVSHPLVTVTLYYKLKLIGQEGLMPVHPDGLKLFSGEEGLETTLDFPHGALGLLEERFQLFHICDGIRDVVA